MDDALRELVDGWLAKAEVDLKAAHRLEPQADEEDYEPAYLDAAAFHLQQAVEKTLKGYLASRSVGFRKIHDLGKLLSLAKEVDSDFDTIVAAADILAPFAVEVRYPGDWGELTSDEYAQAKAAAEEIVGFVSARLGYRTVE